MFQLGANLYKNVPVYVIDYTLETGPNYDSFRQAALTTTALVTQYTDESIEQARKYYNTCQAEHIKALADYIQPNKPMVFITKRMVDELSEKQILAIIAHEAAHIRNGDHLRALKGEFLDDINAELKADEFAAKCFGKDVMLSALLKSFELMAQLYKEIKGASPSAVYNDLINHPKIAPRLTALGYVRF